MGICMLFIDIHQCYKSITVGLNNWWTTTIFGEHIIMHVNTGNYYKLFALSFIASSMYFRRSRRTHQYCLDEVR